MTKILIVALNDELESGLLRAVLNFEIPAGEPPTEVMLIPPGLHIQGRDGRAYLNDNPAGVIEYFQNRQVDLPFDWNHSTELKAPKGEEAPASGWGKQGTMTAHADGSVRINVEWTPRGVESIKTKENRYLSPVYLCDPKTMAIRGISSVGLTNKPNVYIPALNGEQHQPEDQSRGGKIMEFLKKMAALMGLPETATEEEILAACKAMKGEKETAMNQAQNPPLTLFVPRADYDGLMTRAQNAEKAIIDRDAADLAKEANAEVEAALKAKKIAPVNKEYYLKQCNTAEGLANFREFVKSAPVIAADSNLDGKKPGDGDGLQLNAEAKSMAAIFGNSEEDLKKYGGI